MALFIVIVLCIISVINTASIEPICPKFSYDEQLLEKMVRLEFFVENMQKDVKTSVSESKNEMSDLQFEVSKNLTKTIEDIDVKFEALKTNVINATQATEATLRAVLEGVQTKVEELVRNVTEKNDRLIQGIMENIKNHEDMFEDFKTFDINSNKVIEGMSDEVKNVTVTHDRFIKGIMEDIESHQGQFGDLKTFNTNLTKVMERMYEKMTNIEKKMEEFKTTMENNSMKTLEELTDRKYPVVAFNVFDTVKSYKGVIIPFTTVHLNEGGGYDTDTGKFTAPVTGLYQFNAHVCFEKGYETDYYITAGKIRLVKGEDIVPDAASDGKCSSFGGVAFVKEAETAYVGGVISKKVLVNHDDLSSFSGILIRAL